MISDDDVLDWDAEINNNNEVILAYFDGTNAYLRKVDASVEYIYENISDFSNNFQVELNEKGLPFIARQNSTQQDIIVESFCFDPITVNTQVSSIPGPVCEGVPVSYSIGATPNGPFPLTYQWFLYSVFPLAGETNTNLTVNAYPFEQYAVSIFDGCRVYFSEEGQVVIVDPLPSVSEYVNESSCQGEFFELDFAVSNQTSIVWYKDGVLIPGETSTSIVFDPITLADGGTYTIVPSNACGLYPYDASIVLTVDELISTFPILATAVETCGTQYTVDNLGAVNLRSYN